MSAIVRAEHISKRYRIGARAAAYASLRDAVAGSARALLERARRGGGGNTEQVWALRDASFEIKPGEIVGIVGCNGAGKSTLLKILSRITEPTGGRVELYGRVGSLLEVGTGFHPELTGRENVFLNGAILGMRRAEIAQKFDEIVAFSEIERFIDTPVKFYSSGMYVRLAFSVAAHLEPDILIIDEVLSVGDFAFQQKCLDKIGAMRERIRSIILVSHNMMSVRAICSRAMLLAGGVIARDGAPAAVIPAYEKMMLEGLQEGAARDEAEEGSGRIRIDAVRLLDADGRERQEFAVGETARVVVEYDAVEATQGVIAYAAIRRPDGFICTGTSTKLEGVELPVLDGPGVVEVEIPELLVVPGYYMMDVTFYDHNFEHRRYFLGRKKVGFHVVSPRLVLDDKYGVVYQKLRWRVSPGGAGR